MKTAAEITKNAINPQQTTTTGNSRRLLPETWVLGIFNKMKLRYGKLWTTRLTEYDKDMSLVIKEWQQVLSSCTAEDIKRGLESWRSEFPPNVLQFRTACKKTDTEKLQTGDAYKIRPKALPKPPVSESTVLESLKKAREAIHG